MDPLDRNRPSVAATLSLALRIVVLIQSIGLVWTAVVAGSDVETFLFSTVGWSDRLTFAVDRTVAVAFAVVAAVGLVRPWRLGYLLMAAWYLAIPVARSWNGGVPFDELAVGAHAVRWAAPLGVAWLASREADDCVSTVKRMAQRGRAVRNGSGGHAELGGKALARLRSDR